MPATTAKKVAGKKTPSPATGAKRRDQAAQLCERLSEFERFVARRFDEISMEINATSQQVDMAESGLKDRFSEMLDVIEAITHSSDGKSAANSGIELDEVVAQTEDASVRILDAAGRIAIRLQNAEGLADEDLRAEIVEAIKKDLDQIVLACSFQDLTSQRIRMTLERIKSIESCLNATAENLGLDIERHENAYLADKAGASQEDIDALFD